MNVHKSHDRESIRIAMRFPGAEWHCNLSRQTFGFHALVSVNNVYDDSVHTIERSYPSLTKSFLNTEGWLYIDKPTFRIQYSHQRQGSFLSGFIEDKHMRTIQWDIQLFSDMVITGKLCCSAQGRIICDDREMLFPRATTIISISWDAI